MKLKSIILILLAMTTMATASAQTVRRQADVRNQRRRVENRQVRPARPATGTTTNDDKSRRDAINNGFSGQVSKDNATALTRTPLADEALPSVIVNRNGDAFILESTTKSTNVSGEEMFAMPNSGIYPGALVYADKDLADGKPTLVGLSYGKVTLYIDFDNGKQAYKEGVINDAAHVREAINELLRQNGGNYAPPINLNAKKTTYSSTAKMALDLNVSASFLGATANVDTKTSSTETSLVEVQDFTQAYYTVTAVQEPDKSQYFGNDVTWSVIQQRIAQNGPIAMINSVTYGRRAYKFYEYKTSDFSFTGSQSGSYSGTSATVKEDITRSSKASKEWMYIKGGSASMAKEILTGSEINAAAAASLQIGPSNQGVLLTYTASFLASGRHCTAKTSATYNETAYIKCPHSVRWEIKNRASTAGECVKFKAMYNVIAVTGDATRGYSYRIIKGNGGGENAYADYFESKFSNGTQKTRTMPTEDIEKKGVKLENCYVYGPVHYTIRARAASSAGFKWHEDESGYFDVSGGFVKLYMNGSALAGGKGVYIHSDTKPMPIGKK